MRTEPVFCGKIHVTAVKNEKWFWYDYKTSPKDDKKIVELAKLFLPKEYTTERQRLPERKGEIFRSAIEKVIGEKLDIPEPPIYSATHSQDYNPKKKRITHSILLFCQKKPTINEPMVSDRTAIDIYI